MHRCHADVNDAILWWTYSIWMPMSVLIKFRSDLHKDMVPMLLWGVRELEAKFAPNTILACHVDGCLCSTTAILTSVPLAASTPDTDQSHDTKSNCHELTNQPSCPALSETTQCLHRQHRGEGTKLRWISLLFSLASDWNNPTALLQLSKFTLCKLCLYNCRA